MAFKHVINIFLTNQHWLVLICFVAELFNKLVVSKHDSFLTLQTLPIIKQLTNYQIKIKQIINKEAFANSLLMTR